MFCKRCRYNLKLIDSRACPECGRAFDPGNRRTFRKSAGWPKWVRRIVQALLVLFAMALIGIGVIEWRYQRELAAVALFEAMGGHARLTRDDYQWAEGFPFLHKRLQYVTTVKLIGIDLIEVPDEILSHTGIVSLNLRQDQITSLPREIGTLTGLRFLYLSDNQLVSLPTEIGRLTNLASLDLDENRLESLPHEIGHLTNLRILKIRQNRLHRLPPEIENLTRLEVLHLDDNQLAVIPAQIGKLTKLTELWLNENQLATLPPEIGKCTNLTTLWLFGNELESLPTEIGNLSNLKELLLLYNPITDADVDKLKPLTSLRILDIRKTRITKQGLAALKSALPNCQIDSDY